MKTLLITLFLSLITISCSTREEENNPVVPMSTEKKALCYEICSVVIQVDDLTYLSTFCDSRKSLYYYVVFYLDENAGESVITISSKPLQELNFKGRRISIE